MIKNNFKNKKSQFLVLSAYFILLLIIFSYSLGTQNSYIIKKSKFDVLNNIVYETCQIGKKSNGSYIGDRYSNFSLDVKNYCLGLNYICNLTIVNNTAIPPNGNWSKLNYTHYNYSINYSFDKFNYNGDFKC